jgi:hypothetical protein
VEIAGAPLAASDRLVRDDVGRGDDFVQLGAAVAVPVHHAPVIAPIDDRAGDEGQIEGRRDRERRGDQGEQLAHGGPWGEERA